MTSPVERLRQRFRKLRERYQSWRYGAVDADAKVGVRGEQFAARFLRQAGLQIVSQGESDFAGEIDLIALDRARSTVIFVEVKTLATHKPGHPAERVDAEKQARITRAAARYLKRQRLLEARCRFDVVAIWWPPDAAEPDRIEHYPHAFEASGLDSFFS